MLGLSFKLFMSPKIKTENLEFEKGSVKIFCNDIDVYRGRIYLIEFKSASQQVFFFFKYILIFHLYSYLEIKTCGGNGFFFYFIHKFNVELYRTVKIVCNGKEKNPIANHELSHLSSSHFNRNFNS